MIQQHTERLRFSGARNQTRKIQQTMTLQLGSPNVQTSPVPSNIRPLQTNVGCDSCIFINGDFPTASRQFVRTTGKQAAS